MSDVIEFQNHKKDVYITLSLSFIIHHQIYNLECSLFLSIVCYFVNQHSETCIRQLMQKINSLRPWLQKILIFVICVLFYILLWLNCFVLWTRTFNSTRNLCEWFVLNHNQLVNRLPAIRLALLQWFPFCFFFFFTIIWVSFIDKQHNHCQIVIIKYAIFVYSMAIAAIGCNNWPKIILNSAGFMVNLKSI